MARQVFIHGEPQWWPDYYVVNKVKLEPSLTPMQNCWKVIDLQVSIWLNRFKAHSETEDRMLDLEQSCRVAVYSELLRRVRKGQYDRKYSFWLNIRSCAWSCVGRVFRQWVNANKLRINEVDGTALISDDSADHSSVTFFDMVATESVPRLITSSEFRQKRIDWRDAAKLGGKLRSLHDQSEDDYSRYCEDCAELGIQPVNQIVFITKSYNEQEQGMLADYAPYQEYQRQKRWLDKARANPNYKFNRRRYNKAYYEQHKDEINARRRKKRGV